MLSIALCTYNGEKYLLEQLNSILEQTCLPDELVVCDDCSTDNSVEILNTFKNTAPFSIHIHRNRTNLGVLKNFENAINLCRGEIIIFCDQDDVWRPEKLTRLTETLQMEPEAGYVFSNAEVVDENLSPMGLKLWDTIGFSRRAQEQFLTEDQFQILLKKKIVTGATMAVRADVAKLAIPFPVIPYWLHDGWLAFVSSSIGARGLLINEPLILYRQHQNQQIGALNNDGSRKTLSLFEKYRDFKKNGQDQLAAWEKKLRQILEIKRNLYRISTLKKNPIILKNIEYLNCLETHFNARRRINTEKNFGSYALIFQEVISGRYSQFSDSWRSIFRDIFL